MGMTSWSFSILVYHEICWSTSTTVMYGSLQYDINNKDLESGVEYVFFQQGVTDVPGGPKLNIFGSKGVLVLLEFRLWGVLRQCSGEDPKYNHSDPDPDSGPSFRKDRIR